MRMDRLTRYGEKRELKNKNPLTLLDFFLSGKAGEKTPRWVAPSGIPPLGGGLLVYRLKRQIT